MNRHGRASCAPKMPPSSERPAAPTTIVVAAMAVLAICPAALADPQVAVTASLDPTDGWVRAGAYVPVRLRATNASGQVLAEVRITAGGPVETVSPWRIGPAESAEQIVPVFFAGGDLRPEIEFRSARGRAVSLVRVEPLRVRTVPANAAVVAISPGATQPDEAIRWRLRQSLGASTLMVLRMTPETAHLALRGGLVDVLLGDGSVPAAAQVALPPARTETVDPASWRLLGTSIWPASDTTRLWVGLGVFVVAVLAAGAILPGTRPILGSSVLAALAAVAAAVLWFAADIRRSATAEARVFYCSPVAPDPAAVEHLAYLQSRGGATARIAWSASAKSDWHDHLPPLPIPVLASSEDFFRPQMTLAYSDGAVEVSTRRPGVIVRLAGRAAAAFCWPAPTVSEEGLKSVAARTDVVRAILVAGTRALGPDGRSMPVDAWAAQWRSSADADVAFAGRSLAWWTRSRQEGDEPVLLAWFHDAPAAERSEPRPRRWPALVVYGQPR